MMTSRDVPNFMKELLDVALKLQKFARKTGFPGNHPFMEQDFSHVSTVDWRESGVDFVTYIRNAIIGFHSSAEFNAHAQDLATRQPDIKVPRLRRILPDSPPRQEQLRILAEAAIKYLEDQLENESAGCIEIDWLDGIYGTSSENAFYKEFMPLFAEKDISFSIRLIDKLELFRKTPLLQRGILIIGCDHYTANRSFQKAYDLCTRCNLLDQENGTVSADVQDRLWYLSFRLGRMNEAKSALQSWMRVNPLQKRPLVFSAIVAATEQDRSSAYDYLELSGAPLGTSTVGGNVLYAEYKMQDGNSSAGEAAIRHAIYQNERKNRSVPLDYYFCLHNLLLRRGIESTLMKTVFERSGLAATWPEFRIDTITDKTASSYSSDKKVAVVMTAWNAQSYLQRAIDGVLAQTHANLVLIIMDDCSSDATADIGQRAAQDERVIYIRTPHNMGTYSAKNIGIKHALTLGVDYIALCDSDDFWLSVHAEAHLQAMEADESLSCSISQWMRIREDGSVECGLRGRYVESCPHSTFFRAEVFRRSGYFDSVRFGADREFLSRVQLHFGKSSIRTINKILTLGRRHGTSLTTSGAGAITAFNESPVRLKYWENWNDWHTIAILRGEQPFTAGRIEDRPFPVPLEMLNG